MNVFVVGSGGREHAIIHTLKRSKHVNKIYCAPGNGGISKLAEIVHINPMDFDSLVKFAKENYIDVTIAAMDDTLVAGIVDKFKESGLKIFGPTKAAAIIEGSKAFSKNFMKKYNIPTASYHTFSDFENALEFLKISKFPIVIKANGLALGKGVSICETFDDGKNVLEELMIHRKFGNSGDTVVFEEYMTGKEVSVLCFCDGKTILPMVSAQDHKRIFDGDKGLNTGGMGTISPTKSYSKDIHKICTETIFKPTLEGLKDQGIDFIGVIFFGLMITNDGPKVIEYNARFGDPETQVVLPKLKTDLMEIILACLDGNLDKVNLEWEDCHSICVMLASKGYPEDYEKGFKISGLEKFENMEDIFIYHSGTILKDGEFFTNGGRVLGLMAKGKDFDSAKKKAYSAISEINFQGMQYRKDIGNNQ